MRGPLGFQLGLQFGKRQIDFLRDRLADEVRVSLDPCRPLVATHRPRRRRPFQTCPLQPANRARRTDAKPLSRRPAGGRTLNSRNYTFPQIK